MIYLAAGLSGFGVMVFELSLSRMAAPFFGASLPVWASIISVVLVGGALGYGIGGRLSHYANPRRLAGGIMGVSGLIVAVSALLFPSLLDIAADTVDVHAALRLSMLFGCGVGASLPPVGLGIVMPLLVRSGVEVAADSGRVAGRLSAAAAVGSLVGTLLPAFVLFGFLGVRRTMLIVGALLLVLGGAMMKRWISMSAGAGTLLPALLLLPSTSGKTFSGSVLFETESLEHARILVIENPGGERELRLDMAISVQSVFDPMGPSRHGSWPRFLPAALLRTPCDRPPESALILGLAGGTLARDLAFAYPGIAIDGVDTDAVLLDLGLRYFGIPESTGRYAMDARRFINSPGRRYDLIFLDAYKDIYVPFHLATQEFFTEVKGRLETGGVFAANILFLRKEDRLMNRIQETMASVFAHTAVLRTPRLMNAVLFGWDGPALDAKASARCRMPAHAGQTRRTRRFFDHLTAGPPPRKGAVLTDDRADVEYLTHKIAWEAVFPSSNGSPR